MSANNTFNINRFLLLFKQHYIHSNRIMLFSVIAFFGAAFVVLSLVQLENNYAPLNTEVFVPSLTAIVTVSGILFVGHAFPAFRSKETTTSYLTLPASTLEKYLFELIYRVVVTLIILPALFWITFHLHGYFFQIFSDFTFTPITISELKGYLTIDLKSTDLNEAFWIFILVGSLSLLAVTIPFAGAAHFAKQPLVKTLFTVGLLVLFFTLFIYVAVVEFGLEHYRPNDSMFLIPNSEYVAMRFFSIVCIIANLFMLLIAYLKLKEKEV